jgi:hypothetical protein
MIPGPPNVIQYPTDNVNRRFPLSALNELIVKRPGGDPLKDIIQEIYNYGVMKNICLPGAPGVFGFLVDHPHGGAAINPQQGAPPPAPGDPPLGYGRGLGNNAFGLALYRNLPGHGSVSDRILRYIQGQANGNVGRGEQNQWVLNKLAVIGGVNGAFMNSIGYNNVANPRSPVVKELLCEALALAIETFEMLYPDDPLPVPHPLANGFPTLSTNLVFNLNGLAQITSPMWDLITVSAALNGVSPADLLAPPYAGAPNSTATLGILQLTRTDVVPLLGKRTISGGKRKNKNTKRKHRSTHKLRKR